MSDEDTWRALAAREVGERDLTWRTPEGIAIKPLYTQEDAPAAAPPPGIAPFTRGVRATMYAGRPWTLRQYAGFSTAEESNAFYRRNLAAGQRGLSVAFDLATHRGYDSDHPRVAGDVGKAGVAIDTVEDMKRLFDAIPLDAISVSMTMNGAVIPAMAFFIVAAEEQGVAAEKLEGTIQNDILKEFLVRNTYIYPPGPSVRIAADVIAYCAERMPRFNSISISGYHMQEAGATAVQELAFTLADGIAYAQAAMARGLAIDAFAPRLSFFFGVGMNFFMEIAKLRAARLLWSRIMESFGAKDPRSLMLRTHCQTSGVSLAALDPMNNVVRTTIEALAAVMGGTQSLHTNAFDEAIALPTEASAHLARNTQLILQHEAGLTHVADPLGGSYYVEALTRDLADEAWSLIERIEREGGMERAIVDGWPKRAIEEAAAARAARSDRGEDVTVGVNAYRLDEEPDLEALAIDHERVRDAQIVGLAKVRAQRNEARVAGALKALREGARGNANLLALAIDCARVRATLGEISAAIADVFGRYETKPAPVSGIYGGAFGGDGRWRSVREAVNATAQRLGRRPRLMVAKLGQDGHDRGANLVASAFADAGFDVTPGPLFQTPEEAADLAISQSVDIVGVSTLAGAHKSLAPELLDALRTRGRAEIPVIVGGIVPAADQASLRAAGVVAIYGPGTNLVEAIADALRLLGANAPTGEISS